MENKSLLHGSAIVQNDKAYVFSSFPDVGKSNISLYLLRDGRAFWADGNVSIDEEGIVYSFPLSIPVATYNLKYFNFNII